MTREELEQRLAWMIEGARDSGKSDATAAREAVRLVVEACCDIAESWTPEGVYAAEEIRSTFLPTEARDGE